MPVLVGDEEQDGSVDPLHINPRNWSQQGHLRADELGQHLFMADHTHALSE